MHISEHPEEKLLAKDLSLTTDAHGLSPEVTTSLSTDPHTTVPTIVVTEDTQPTGIIVSL